MEADEIHRTALVHYKKVTDKIREIVGNKLFYEAIIDNQAESSSNQITQLRDIDQKVEELAKNINVLSEKIRITIIETLASQKEKIMAVDADLKNQLNSL